MSELEPVQGERISKIIARCGVCSRREAEVLIAEGRVALNGKKVTTLGTRALPSDHIRVDKKLLPTQEHTRLWLLHKPKGYLTTTRDPKDRPCVFSLIPKHLPRMVSVGRLDFNSEGLLLLTNDGELARRLEHPSFGWKRKYRVRAFGEYTKRTLEPILRPVTIDGIRYKPAEIVHERSNGGNHWFLVTLTEGKNREIRKLFEHVDLAVNRLLRVSYGPFQLGTLKEGEMKEVSGKILKEQLGQTQSLKHTS